VTAPGFVRTSTPSLRSSSPGSMLARDGVPGVLPMSSTTVAPEPVTRTESPGRTREVGRVSALVHGLPDRGGALLVTGDPGIGKTTLLDVARRQALGQGAVVVAVAGVAVERHLPFAGLQRILQPLAPHLPGLAEPQRRALLRATGAPSYDGPAPTTFALGLALLELLGAATRVAPVVLLVDDAQWLDPPTTELLGFLGRRLDAEPVVLVLASRAQVVPDVLQDLPGLRLGPLAPDVARAVVGDESPLLSAPQVEHVLEGPAATRSPCASSPARRPGVARSAPSRRRRSANGSNGSSGQGRPPCRSRPARCCWSWRSPTEATTRTRSRSRRAWSVRPSTATSWPRRSRRAS
jgi:hypothetical protein